MDVQKTLTIKVEKTTRMAALSYFLLSVVVFTLFLEISSCEASSFILDRRAVEAVNWLESSREKIARARMFYRIVEGMWGARTVVVHYAKRSTVAGIREDIPEMAGKDAMDIFMSDWPSLAPVSWKWVEVTRDGVVVFNAGEVGFHDDSEIERIFHPWWIVDLRIPFPRPSTENPFLSKAAARLIDESPSIRTDVNGVTFTVFPGADMMRRIIDATYVMRLQDDWEKQKGGTK